MNSEFSRPTNIEFIDLHTDRIAEPHSAHRIAERYYGIAGFTPQRPFLVTRGLSACKGLSIYDGKKQIGLLAHIAVANDLETMIEGLVGKVGGTLRGTNVHVVLGTYEARYSGIGYEWDRKWPTIDELINELQKYSPSRLLVDEHPGSGMKSIALNLENGKLHEIDLSTEMPWSDQDTFFNRSLRRLETMSKKHV